MNVCHRVFMMCNLLEDQAKVQHHHHHHLPFSLHIHYCLSWTWRDMLCSVQKQSGTCVSVCVGGTGKRPWWRFWIDWNHKQNSEALDTRQRQRSIIQSKPRISQDVFGVLILLLVLYRSYSVNVVSNGNLISSGLSWLKPGECALDSMV